MNHIKNFSRRSFLYGLGACLALPYMESFAVDKPDKEDIKRLIFLGNGYGFTNDTFYPEEAGRFADINLTEGLSPLKRHQNDITMLGNLTNFGASDPHAGSTSFLSCANVAGTLGKRFHNSISCDQVAAEHLGKKTRFSYLALSTAEKKGGHGPGLSMSWDKNGKPISGINSPLELYTTIFASKNENHEQLLTRLKNKQSVLDTMKVNAKSLNRKVSKDDREKLDEYFQSLRQAELELRKQYEWSKIPKPQAPFKMPAEVTGEAEVKLMYDMIAMALQSDSTRVVTYRQPVQSVLTSMDISLAVHSLSHYGFSQARKDASRARDKKSCELFAYFIDRLKEKKVEGGKTLFDNSTACFGTNLRTGHQLKNLPLIITGRGSGFKLGEHLVLEKNTPLANVWLTILQETGISIDSFSHSTGVVHELFA